MMVSTVEELVKLDCREVKCGRYCACKHEDAQAELSHLAEELAATDGRAERTRWMLEQWQKLKRKFKYRNIFQCSQGALLFGQFVCKLPMLDYSNSDNRELHRDIFEMLMEMFNEETKSFWKQYGPALVEHLCEELKRCTDEEVLVPICSVIIGCVEYSEVPRILREEMANVLQLHVRYFEEEDRARPLYEVDARRCVVGLAVSWTRERLLFDVVETWPRMQLVNGCWAARNAHPEDRIPVLVAYPIQHGVFYFEVRVLTGGWMQIGWTSRLTTFNRRGRVTNEHLYIFIKLNTIPADAIVSSFLDLEEKRVEFYLNGQRQEDIELDASFFDFTPFFATVCLTPFQTVIFNIGQEPFRYQSNVLKQYSFDSIHSAVQQSRQSCRLMAPITWEGDYLFDYSQLKQALPLLFHDEKQQEVDQVVRKEVDRVLKGGRVDEERLKRIKEEYGLCRPVQSMVEVLGEGLEDDEVAVMAYWVNEVMQTYFYGKDDGNAESFIFLFSYYLKLSPLPEDWMRHRQLCMVLAGWPNYDYPHWSDFDKWLLCYLVAILSAAGRMEDCWTQLYALVALTKNHEESIETIINAIKASEKAWKQITTWAGEFDAEEELKGRVGGVMGGEAARLQRYLVAQKFARMMQEEEKDRKTGIEGNKGRPTSIRLSEQDKSSYLELSLSGLMARSDHSHWQSVRSQFAIIPGTFYFEVTILTPGPMRIGLAARQMEIEPYLFTGTEIGSNALSIGFDGYHGCVWMGDQKFQPKYSIPPWRVGDVVGIYFDSFARFVTFTLNEKIIQLTADPFADEFIFSKLETHVALSLHTHQQVYCNFQCTTIPPVLKGQQPIQISIHNSSLTNTMFLANSQATSGNINISQHVPQDAPCPSSPKRARFDISPFSAPHPSPSSPLSTPLPDFRLCRVLSTLLVSTDPAKLQHNLSPPILNDLETMVRSMQQRHQGHDDQDTLIHLLSEQMKRQISEFKAEKEGRKAIGEQEDADDANK